MSRSSTDDEPFVHAKREANRVLAWGGAIAAVSFLTFAVLLFNCAGYDYPGIQLHTRAEAFCKGPLGTIVGFVSAGGVLSGIVMIVIGEWRLVRLRHDRL